MRHYTLFWGKVKTKNQTLKTKYFDENHATVDETWEWYLGKYNNSNPLAQFLLNQFFSIIKRIIDILEPSDKLLEVGCGAGASSRRILGMLNGQEFEVSDYDKRLVKKLIKTGFPIKVTRESVLELTHRSDDSFDCVFVLEVLEHIEDYRRALSELFRVSKKYVVISVPNEPLWSILNIVRGKYIQEFGNTPSHLHRWSVNSLRKLISEYGTVTIVYTPMPWIVILAKKT